MHNLAKVIALLWLVAKDKLEVLVGSCTIVQHTCTLVQAVPTVLLVKGIPILHRM